MTDRYVDPASGVDTDAGTIGAPWRTLAKLHAAATGTDRAYLRRAGLFYPWRETLICDRAGSAGSPIIYGPYGEQINVPTKALAPDPPAPIRTVPVATKAELDTAISSAVAGDHIVCTAAFTALYTGGVTVSKNGTSANPIVIWGYGTPGHWSSPQTVLSNDGGDVYTISGTYLQYRNVRFTGWFYGPFVTGNNLVFDSCEDDNTQQQCFHVRDSSHHVYFQRCHVHNTGLASNQFAETFYIGNDTSVNNVYILRCWTHDHKAEGLESSGSNLSSCWYERNFCDGFGCIYQPGQMNTVVSIAGQNHTYVQNYIRYGAPYGFYWQAGVTNSGHTFRLNRVALFDKNNPTTAHGYHLQAGSNAFFGADNICTDIPGGGAAYYGLGTPSTAYPTDAGVTPRIAVLGLDPAYYWVRNAGVANTWYTTDFASAPAKVRFDRVLGTSKGSVAACTSERDWFWDSGTSRLYVRTMYHPYVAYQNPGIEASQRTAVAISAAYTRLQAFDAWGPGA